MLIFIITSLISRHLICLPAASIDDRQLYLGIVPSFKNLNFSLESFFIYILVISELTGYMLTFSWSRSALPAPPAATTLHWLSPHCDIPQRLTASEAQLCNHMHAQFDTVEIPKTTDQCVCKCRHAQDDLQDWSLLMLQCKVFLGPIFILLKQALQVWGVLNIFHFLLNKM